MTEINVNSLRNLAIAKRQEEQDLYISQVETLLPNLLNYLHKIALRGNFEYTLKASKVPDFLGKYLQTIEQYDLILGKLADTLQAEPYNFKVSLFIELEELCLTILWNK
jgi:hypothetical protein